LLESVDLCDIDLHNLSIQTCEDAAHRHERQGPALHVAVNFKPQHNEILSCSARYQNIKTLSNFNIVPVIASFNINTPTFPLLSQVLGLLFSHCLSHMKNASQVQHYMGASKTYILYGTVVF
jgi:hypothetical protein